MNSNKVIIFNSHLLSDKLSHCELNVLITIIKGTCHESMRGKIVNPCTCIYTVLFFFYLILTVQTLECTTTPENRSVQTVQHSVPRSNRSVQTIQCSVHRSNHSVQTVQRSVHRSNRSVQTVKRSVLRSNRSKRSPIFRTPSVSHYQWNFRVIDQRKYFCKYFS
jgi:hypothetical protein